jgi:hypothetical protein
LNASLTAFGEKLTNIEKDVNVSLTAFGEKLTKVEKDVSSINGTLSALASAAQTPSNAKLARACAERASVYMSVSDGRPGRSNHSVICSAAPVPLDLLLRAFPNDSSVSSSTASTYFLTAGHCFYQGKLQTSPESSPTDYMSLDDIGRDVTIYYGKDPSKKGFACTRIVNLVAPHDGRDKADIALVRCSEPVPVQPPRLASASSDVDGSLLVIGGYVPGQGTPEVPSFKANPRDDSDQSTVIQRAATTFATPVFHTPNEPHPASDSIVEAAGASDFVLQLSSSRKHSLVRFMSHSPGHGESGGPILTVIDCGFVGMTVSRSGNGIGGIYFSLLVKDFQEEIVFFLRESARGEMGATTEEK